MPRYFRLGVSKNSDKDTCLFNNEDTNKDLNLKDGWVPSLRRAKSSREPQCSKPGEDRENTPPSDLNGSISTHSHSNGVAVQTKKPSSEQVEKAPCFEQYSNGIDKQKLGSQLQQPQPQPQQQQQPHLPRTQSMRYNRILCKEDDFQPPRHSSFTGDEHHYHHHQQQQQQQQQQQCAKCGKFVQSFMQDERKLCEICRPLEDEEIVSYHHRSSSDPKTKRGFVKGLRKMFGLLSISSSSSRRPSAGDYQTQAKR